MLGVITVLAQNGVADLLAAGEAHADAGRNQCVDVKPVLAHLWSMPWISSRYVQTVFYWTEGTILYLLYYY
jgi:hypothetical protein